MKGPIPPDVVTTSAVLHEVLLERRSQDSRWGQQDHRDYSPAAPDTEETRCWWLGIARSAGYRAALEAEQTSSWAAILMEEVAEVVEAAPDPKALRAELVQVAAVSVAWIECLDRRSTQAAVHPLPPRCGQPGCPHLALEGAPLCEGCWDLAHTRWEGEREPTAPPVWVPPPTLHRCASPDCPGLPWGPSSSQPHPCGRISGLQEVEVRDEPDLVRQAIDDGEARAEGVTVLAHYDGLLVGREEGGVLVAAHGLREEGARELVGLLQRSTESTHVLIRRWVEERAKRMDLEHRRRRELVGAAPRRGGGEPW